MRSKFILISSLAISLSGCATMVRGTEQHISINSVPPGAETRLSDGQTCITPCNIKASRKNSLSYTMHKEGCQVHSGAIIPTLGGAGVMLGGLVDYGTGAVYDLQPNPVHAHLNCNSK